MRRAESLYNNAKQARDDSWKVEPDSNRFILLLYELLNYNKIYITVITDEIICYSGSVELGETCSPMSNVSVSRVPSVETEVRHSSHSSVEALPHK